MSIPTQLNPLGIYHSQPFKLTVKITDAPQTLDLRNNIANNAIVKDWGDGTVDNNTTHTYTQNGTYVVSLSNPNNVTLTEFVPWRSSDLVAGCNWKWDSLGDIRQVNMPSLNNYSMWESGICTSLPRTLTSMLGFFGYPCNLPCYISSIPDGVTSLSSCGNVNGNATFVIDKLPPNITTLYRAFRLCNKNGVIDIGKIVDNAPLNGFDKLKSVIGFCAGTDTCINGTVAQFMNKCPNVTEIKTSAGSEPPFLDCPKIQLFSDNDHFECVINIPSDNYTWGFIPYSSKGTWYLIQWGDINISSTSNNKTANCLHTFTSGTKVEHTYTKAGTYTIKLCCNTSSIVFDTVVSHNNQLQFLGDVNGVSFN